MNNYIIGQPNIQNRQGAYMPPNFGYPAQTYPLNNTNIQPAGYYYAPQNAVNNAVNPALGLYNNFVNPNMPTGYTLLGTQKTPYGDRKSVV